MTSLGVRGWLIQPGSLKTIGSRGDATMNLVQRFRNFMSVPFFTISIVCNATSMVFVGLDKLFTKIGVKIIGVSQEDYDNIEV